MTGPNQACPCGSGKKYKKCHGRMDQATVGRHAGEQLAQARALLGQKFFEAAWDAIQVVPESAERCRLEVEILLARRGEHDLETAHEAVDRWQRLQPGSPEPWSKKFEIALNQVDHAAMDRALSHLLRIAPGHARTLYYQGLRAQIDGGIPEAIAHYAAAAAQQFPDFSPATVRVMAASKAIDTAMGKHPGSLRKDWALLLGQPAIVDALEANLENCDDRQLPNGGKERSMVANAWYKLAAARRQGMVDAEKCQYYCTRALQLNPDHQAARSTYLFTLNYDLGKSPEQIHALHVAAGDWWAGRFPERKYTFPNARQEDKVLRVAYLSTDFRQHPVVYFILPVLQHHDVKRVRTYVYHMHPSRDEYTQRAAQSAGQFLHAFDFDDQALARQIERDGIDILVDLNGTSGQGRLSLLARRAAPIQMTWLGCPNTTGLPTVDYRIVDANTDPPPSAQAWNREQLLYLPRQFSVYDPLESPPPVAVSPCLQRGYVTFGSFNNIAKLNPPLLGCWAEMLSRVPASRLIIKYPSLDYEPLRQELLHRLEKESIDPTRIQFIGRIKSRYEHLEAYSLIDIQLDTFPYHGTTTSCESLLMGVPVVTRAGADHRSRVGVSLLSSVGRADWISRDRSEYVQIATRLAHDPETLAKTRVRLRGQVQTSALMDAKRFTRELERAYRDCWARWCRTKDENNMHATSISETR
jgi:predicted O-linked N-acetylglucosamine transferase (SPINDLY family)